MKHVPNCYYFRSLVTQSRSCLKKFIIKIVILSLPYCLFSQELSGLRERVVTAGNDTIRLDTVPVVAGSITLTTNTGVLIDSGLYRTDPVNSLLLIDKDFPWYGEELIASYRVFTAGPDLTLSRKDTAMIIPWQREASDEDPFRYTYRPVSDDFWREETLMRSGSISRGITFGNNQDVIVNSNLNLQLSGKLDDNLNIVASISDQNIPLQPEGYSMQIHEFDKVFIQLYNDNVAITAGDFGIGGGEGIFLPLDRKAQGVQFTGNVEPAAGPFSEVRSTSSAAMAKGRYHRNSFTGTEGNQGPYKLKGPNNELFIIVLAGSERVFVDGRLLARGADRHYVIDYNLAEITFTSNMPITRDRRILVEFEYSDRNYARYMFSNTTGLETESGSYFVNLYSEHDARNQPLLQELRDEDIELLASIGDSINKAWIPRVDSVEFRNDVVLYEKADTVVDGIQYSIYRHSADPAKAFYRPAFSYLGEQSGNYRQVKSAANGRVFEWTPPVNGVPSGTHEPVTLLVTPKKLQIASMGGSHRISVNTEATFELALSNNDLNTFSALDNENNTGMAFRTGIDNLFPLDSEGHSVAAGIEYEFAGNRFATTERYRPPEYERDWNLSDLAGTADEHRLGWYAGYERNNRFARYMGEYLALPGIFSGLLNTLEASVPVAGFEGSLDLSYLSTETPVEGSGFIRHTAEVSRPLWVLILGVRSEGEDNRKELAGSGSLSPSSFAFHQWEVFLRNPDTSAFHFFTAFSERNDKLPFNDRLEHYSLAREISAGFRSRLAHGNRLSATLHHRMLEMDDARLDDLHAGIGQGHAGMGQGLAGMPDNSLNGRIEAVMAAPGGAIQGTLFYETGSGLEMIRDFMFIEVARGQGTHTWTDYNDNGIKELDEFEPAAFPDQANYIRVMIPSDEFVRTRSGQFSQTLRLGAPSAWHGSAGIRGFVSLFSNNSAFRAAHKTAGNSARDFSPFHINLADTNLLNLTSSFRNTLSFRSPGRSFSLEYLHSSNKSRNLLVNGLETREDRSDALHGRYEQSPRVTFISRVEKGERQHASEFFPGRDFSIDLIVAKAGISVQPGHALQTSLNMEYMQQTNSPGGETAVQQKLGTEVRYTLVSRGNITAGADYFHITYDAPPNTPLAWEMLGGLRPGNNVVLNVQWEQTFAGNLQISLNYSGRTSSGTNFIHTGGMQVRAYF